MFFRIVFVTLAISTIPLHLLAQAPGGQNLPPGFVDGSKNPTLIPDHASYRLVMIHLASLGSADSTRAAARQRAVYSRIGLSPADTITLQTHITAFKAAYSQWQTGA